MEISIENIKRKFEKLPEDLKWAIIECNIDEKIKKIGEIHNLNIRQMGQLSFEIHAVIVGFNPINNFYESISKSLGIEEEKLKIITKRINEEIFINIRSKLMDFYNKNKNNDKENEEILNTDYEDYEEIEEEEIPNISYEKKEIKEKNKEEIKKNDFINSAAYKKLVHSFPSTIKQTDYSLNEKKVGDNVNKKDDDKIDPYRMPIE